jgi:hypothetical protein
VRRSLETSAFVKPGDGGEPQSTQEEADGVVRHRALIRCIATRRPMAATSHAWTFQVLNASSQGDDRVAYLFCPTCGELRITSVAVADTQRLDIDGDCPARATGPVPFTSVG